MLRVTCSPASKSLSEFKNLTLEVVAFKHVKTLQDAVLSVVLGYNTTSGGTVT